MKKRSLAYPRQTVVFTCRSVVPHRDEPWPMLQTNASQQP
ncbi:hypothetical protein RB7599 [Rhodopirellula baltica SH 1]|uniref:Uncharacterized protein n=1 Tax=Rhodopirellula baltica (strain DSM 10527 / NCIMB 13988 / SH1) TaxID=243090 RepID=Q7UNG0_RHOBA|nr:hypothetical protein RB7599 [Rhodopirellula baltica SH 1]